MNQAFLINAFVNDSNMATFLPEGETVVFRRLNRQDKCQEEEFNLFPITRLE
jgi:hypothetical protein